MVLETKSALESGMVSSGHSFAAARLDGQRSIAGWVGEQTGGLTYLLSIRQLAQRVDSDWDGVQADLAAIRCSWGSHSASQYHIEFDTIVQYLHRLMVLLYDCHCDNRNSSFCTCTNSSGLRRVVSRTCFR